MSATMARQGGWVQLEQSDMLLPLNIAKMAKGGFSRAAMEETQFLIKNPRAEVREETTRGVEFPGHKNVKAAMNGHPAMLRENQTDRCLPCQNGTAQNPLTCWRRKGTVHLHQSNSDSWQQNQHHIHPKRHLFHLVTMRQLTYPKSRVCHPDMCIYILFLPVLNFSLLMHMPRIASVIKFSIQICRLINEHPLVGTLSAAW